MFCMKYYRHLSSIKISSYSSKDPCMLLTAVKNIAHDHSTVVKSSGSLQAWKFITELSVARVPLSCEAITLFILVDILLMFPLIAAVCI